MVARTRRSPLKPRARLMQHLGEDLIPNDRVALFELIKNSYDADASTVIVRFLNLGTEDASLEVWDDGHGMDEHTVASNWLEIANPNRQQRPTSESGRRRVLGAKGLGRFAVARLANQTNLVTRRAGSDEVALSVNWDDFNDDDLFLEDVEVGWSVRSAPVVFAPAGEATAYFHATLDSVTAREDTQGSQAQRVAGRVPPAVAARTKPVTRGTLMRLSGLRGEWTEPDLKALTNALSRLTPPPPPTELGVTAVPEFQVLLDVDGEEVIPVGPSPTIAKPAYRLLGTVGADGRAALTFRTTHDAEDESFEVDIAAAAGCGPLAVDLRVWDLESDALRTLRRADAGTRTLAQVRKQIRDSSGVALYRDGFRVQPYGDPDVDWLGLDARRVNNPTLRVSNNQLVGFVFTTAEANPDLRDQANRQGLIQNEALASLQGVIRTMLELLEDRRYRLRRAPIPGPVARQRAGGIFAAFSLDDLRSTVRTAYPKDTNLHRAIDKAEADIERGVESVQEVISRFSRLSTLGSLVDVLLHEGNTALSSANFLIGELEALMPSDEDVAANLASYTLRLQSQVDALRRMFRNLEPLSGRRRGRPRNVDVVDLVGQAVDVLEGELLGAGVEVSIKGNPRTVTLDVADVMQIVINLVRNAIYWTATQHPAGDRKIHIEIRNDDDNNVVIQVSDNGPGVPPDKADLIFDAYYTTRSNGVGLGLNIAGSIAADFYDGDLALIDNGPLPGATFQVTLRRRLG